MLTHWSSRIRKTCFTSLYLLLDKLCCSENRIVERKIHIFITSIRKKWQTLIFRFTKIFTLNILITRENSCCALAAARNVLNSLEEPSILTISNAACWKTCTSDFKKYMSVKKTVNLFLPVHFIYILFPRRTLRRALQNRNTYIISDLHIHSYTVPRRYNPAFF